VSNRVIGLSAVVFSLIYLVSDLVELAQGGFSTFQLVLTYVAEAAIPLFVLGLYAAQRPLIGWLGFAGAVGYAYAYVFFTATVVLALVDGIPDWPTLAARLAPWITLHGVVLVAAGVAFGVAVARAGVLPAWTGWLLVAGVVLVAVASGLSDIAQTVAAAVRDAAFVAMGAALLRRRHDADRAA